MKNLMIAAIIFLTMLIGSGTVLAEGETELSVFNSFHSYGINDMYVSPNGKTIVTGGQDATANIWNVQTGAKKELEDISYKFIHALAFSPDGQYFAIAAGDNYGMYNSLISIYDSQSGELSETLNIEIGSWVSALSFSNDGKSLIIGYSSSVVVFDMNSKKIGGEYSTNGHAENIKYRPNRHEFAVSVASDFSGNAQRILQIRSSQTGEILKSIDNAIPNQAKDSNDIQYSPDGKYLIVSYNQYDKSGSKVYDAENNYDLITDLDAYGDISFNQDSSLVVIGQYVYSVSDNFKTSYKIKTNVNNGTLSPFSTILSLDGKYLISQNGDEIFVLDAKNLSIQLIDIQIDPEEVTVGVNEKTVLKLQGIYSDGSKKALQMESVKWTIKDFYVAEMKDNTLYGTNKGETTLSVSYNGLTDSIDVNVTDTSDAAVKDSSSQESLDDVDVDSSLYKQIILQVNNTSMLVNGLSLPLDENDEIKPVIREGRTLLPIASIIREFGGTVDWDGAERKVSINLGNNKVALWIDQKNAIVNGEAMELEVAPAILKGKTMVPLRFVSENTGIKLMWHGSNQIISLYYHPDKNQSTWFEGDHVEHISDTQGEYFDGGAMYSIQYPLGWGDPYVINNIYSANNIEAVYDYETVFYDSNGTQITGDAVALNVDESGQFETAEAFMMRTGREEDTIAYEKYYQVKSIEQREHPASNQTYFFFTADVPISEEGLVPFKGEFLFFKGAYVVIIKFSASVDSEILIEGDSSLVPQLDEFNEAIDSLEFLDGAGAAG
ncbi:stalk domain-containing protein [Paenibacillus sp. HB172176]|uniref:stalk domain-containing protein n=1 Tax=Paenibacillus sp. HB172176 TaxID=2493690 RepID=UPI001438A847|nr:stalk domain-containing protein [Paenibacillus sp. HB172176]